MKNLKKTTLLLVRYFIPINRLSKKTKQYDKVKKLCGKILKIILTFVSSHL